MTTAESTVPETVRRRLAPLDARLHPHAWTVTLAIAGLAAILRLTGISSPTGLVFDEIYYPTDAWDMLQRGIEWDQERGVPAYVVHPPLGKWLIALGEAVFGYNALGWRVSGAIAGTLMVVILIRVALRMFRSVVLAGTAGLLMALDGFHLVLSRMSLLDIFVGLFVLAAFAALVLDRDHYRGGLLRSLENGPRAGVPWWLLGAGVLIGLAVGVKWNALFFLPFFAAMILTWRFQARRSAGHRRPFRDGILADLGWGLLSCVLGLVVYLATWTGWLLSDDGYARHHRAGQGLSEPPVLGALLNLWHYHQSAYGFHSTLTTSHTYQSSPWQWLLLGRPVLFYLPNTGDCVSPDCARVILLLGTPILWWSFLPALVALVWFGISRRDWRAYAILTGAAAGLLPWFYVAAADDRTMFSFYTLPALPFLILAVVYVLGAMMSGPHRTLGILVAGLYVTVVALCFAYFHPIFVGEPIPYQSWLDRMWLGNRWI